MRKLIKVTLFIFILLLICSASYFAFKYFVYGEVYQERPDIEKGSILDKILSKHEEDIYKPSEDVKQRAYSVLLTGIDSENMDHSRTDTIMVAFIDPKNKKTSILSIPRDTYVQIAGRKMDKITHAHNYGINSTIMTVEDFLDVKIDYYATINFNGFLDLVDTLGGVHVDVEKNMTFPDRITGKQFSLEKGEQKLTAIQALNYARFRSDGEGDFGRNRRQQQVLKAIVDESTSFRNVTKIKGLLDDLGDNVKTDMDFDVLSRTLAKMKSTSSENIYTIPMDAYPTFISGVSYVQVKEDSLEQVKSYIKDVLDGENPKPIDTDSNK